MRARRGALARRHAAISRRRRVTRRHLDVAAKGRAHRAILDRGDHLRTMSAPTGGSAMGRLNRAMLGRRHRQSTITSLPGAMPVPLAGASISQRVTTTPGSATPVQRAGTLIGRGRVTGLMAAMRARREVALAHRAAPQARHVATGSRLSRGQSGVKVAPRGSSLHVHPRHAMRRWVVARRARRARRGRMATRAGATTPHLRRVRVVHGSSDRVRAAAHDRHSRDQEAKGVANRRFTVTIDGPAAAGKSTVGAEVANQLSGIFFDTGLLYRAATLAALRHGAALDDGAALAAIAAGMRVEVRQPSVDDGRHSDVLLAGEDVTRCLRASDIDRSVSQVSAHPAVRAALLEPQRRIGRSGVVVMVGRDIGTTVMPDAELKVYLDASQEERARRRHAQPGASDAGASYAEVLADIRRRDASDAGRVASPLRAAPDAIVINTDGRPVDEVVTRIVIEALARMGANS